MPQTQTAEGLQAQLPAAIRYTRAEEIVQLQAAFEHVLTEAVKQVKTKNHLHAHQVQRDHNIPLFTLLAKWLQLQTGDLLRWAQGAFLEAVPEEPLIGIPVNESEALLAGLEELHELCSTHMLEEYRERAVDVLGEMREVIEGLTLEEDEDEEDDSDEGDFDEVEDDDAEGILADEGAEGAGAEGEAEESLF